MITNKIFSFKRFVLLCKHSLVINPGRLVINTLAPYASIFLYLLFTQNIADNQGNGSYVGAFSLFFFIFGIVGASKAFAGFRSKEACINYLTLPASTLEKYLFELFSVIILFIIVFPLGFWCVANMSGLITHYYHPNFILYHFSFSSLLNMFPNGWEKMVVISVSLLALVLSFMGASIFNKRTLGKTVLSLLIVIISCVSFFYIIVRILHVDLIKQKYIIYKIFDTNLQIMASIFFSVSTLTFLVVAYYRLKEKEV